MTNVQSRIGELANALDEAALISEEGKSLEPEDLERLRKKLVDLQGEIIETLELLS